MTTGQAWFDASTADMRADDWEVLVWRILPGAGGACGVFSSVQEIAEARS